MTSDFSFLTWFYNDRKLPFFQNLHSPSQKHTQSDQLDCHIFILKYDIHHAGYKGDD